ncbi:MULTISPECIES: hypothetical protein [unclassified Vibrio]|uniref:hypothetical protein n=2 Tax=Vibrio TaxID=662 RepID=UPI000B8ED9BE|nr:MULTISPECIES: hypothetical protein [unclassified Vibrio]NAW89382.1 hypothetical protein [Vibrio sp. V24_P1S3T111]OXX33316.1 hypothetical protein B9J81_10520 [Vibrio sp. V04_P4A5T148]OXX33918.1 hypothetical protein B9J95_04640 [Vibrio sp. V14_P6S14T42]
MNKRAIECVFGSFRNDFINIKKLECDDKYKITLYLCLIDGISNLSVPNEKQNRNRFISTLKKFSDWTDGGLISIQQLNAFIHSDVKDIDELQYLATEEMSIFVKNRLFPTDEMLAVSGFTTISQVDIKSDEIISLWNKYASDNGKLHKAYIDQFSHFSLLYELRNNLIHSFQNCSGASHGIYNEPGYKVVNTHSNSEEQLVSGHRVELVYPLSFIEKVTDRVLVNTQSYFESNNIDVLQYINESDVWRMQ